MNIDIKRADEGSLEEIMFIERNCFAAPWSEHSIRSELLSRYAYCTVADLDGKAVGFCILHELEDEGEILNIAVLEEYRGKGIGKRLLRDALEYAENCGILKMFLEVRKGNKTARSMYGGAGFEEISIRKNYYTQPLEDAVIMMREAKKQEM
jgi:ribosomal-protein-alanine N-acetyltransferase